jgi:hypothetical protein
LENLGMSLFVFVRVLSANRSQLNANNQLMGRILEGKIAEKRGLVLPGVKCPVNGCIQAITASRILSLNGVVATD